MGRSVSALKPSAEPGDWAMHCHMTDHIMATTVNDEDMFVNAVQVFGPAAAVIQGDRP